MLCLSSACEEYLFSLIIAHSSLKAKARTTFAFFSNDICSPQTEYAVRTVRQTSVMMLVAKYSSQRKDYEDVSFR